MELLQAALAEPQAALASWQAWRARGASAAPQGVSDRWLPLIRWNLRGAPLDAASRALLDEGCARGWAATRHLLAQARPVLEALSRAGIATIVLKGAALALTVYPRPALRPFGDVDVLVEPETGAAARTVLEGLGWHPLQRVAPSSLSLRHSLGFTNAAGARLDLHWHALAECCGGEADRAFWRRAERQPVADWPTQVLSAPDQLLHVAIHGLRWSSPPSRHWIADAAMILRHAGPSLDWTVLIEEARRRRLTYQMGRALDALRRVVPVDIPVRAAAALAAGRAGWRERLEYQVKRAPRSRARLLFLFWCVYCRATPGQSVARRSIGFARLVPALAGWASAPPPQP